jgi:hypothetical protein
MMEEDRAVSNLSRAEETESSSEAQLEASPADTPRVPKRRFVGRRTATASTERQRPATETEEQSTSKTLQRMPYL